MTLYDLIQKALTQGKRVPLHEWDMEELHQHLRHGDVRSYVWEDAFKDWSEGKFFKIPLRRWLCTDTVVGWEAYFWGEEFMALRVQTARKTDPEFFFSSDDMACRVRDLLDQAAIWYDSTISPTILTLESEMGEGVEISEWEAKSDEIVLFDGVPTVASELPDDAFAYDYDKGERIHSVVGRWLPDGSDFS